MIVEKTHYYSGTTWESVVGYHIVSTRMFVTDISIWPEFGRAHAQFSEEIKPCATMVELARLIDERILIEIEADAIVQ